MCDERFTSCADHGNLIKTLQKEFKQLQAEIKQDIASIRAEFSSLKNSLAKEDN